MIKHCAVSGEKFEIGPEDFSFYQKMGVPLPTLCPGERQRRRLAWRNERKLYRRNCSATNKSIVSIHHANVAFPVVAMDYWWSDAWNPKDFGQEYDFNKSFFEQFKELKQRVPHIALLNATNDNSEYVNLSAWNKDCYLLFESDNNRECLYADHCFHCSNSLDLSYVTRSELCYQCLCSSGCYQSAYLENCENCSSSYFLKNCIGCTNCFSCVNLRHQSYCIWNKQYSKEEYYSLLSSFQLNSRKKLNQLKLQFGNFAEGFPVKYYEGRFNDHVSGNYLWESKDSFYCFDSRKLRNCKWVCNCENTKDSVDVDVYGGEQGMELIYEGHGVGNGAFNCAFNNCIFQSVRDSYYCDFCHFSSNLFGCIGLRSSEFCILNKQYSEKDYFSLKERIIKQMTASGEWGEFFPITLSPFAYNETIAQEYYPLSKEEILKNGWSWYEEPKQSIEGFSFAPDILETAIDKNRTFLCTQCSLLYRLQTLEINFYKNNNLPPPELCHECRYLERMKKRLPRKLYFRKEEGKSEGFLTPYSPERKERLLSEKEYEEQMS